MNIRILNEQDVRIYRELRLRALQVSPNAFASTYEQEVTDPLEIFAAKLRPTDERFILGAFNELNGLIAIVSFVQEDDPKTCHKGHALSLFVAPEGRKQGVGKRLMNELISLAKKQQSLKQINLTVASENRSAKNLYVSLGFETYGVEKNSFKFDDAYYDVDFMVLNV